MKTKNGSILFVINTPGQAYTWHHCIQYFQDAGYKVGIMARDQGPTLEILSSFGFKYTTFAPIRQKLLRPLEILTHIRYGIEVCKVLHPDIIIGFGIDSALLAKMVNTNSIIFTDNESTPVQNYLTRIFANQIITPSQFKLNLGKNHIRIAGYKELAYLHPNYYKPDPSIYGALGIKKDDKYVILRFNSFGAVHDIGKKGFSDADKHELVKLLEKHIRVFISAEGYLNPDLQTYKLPIKPTQIHHAMHYAEMLVSDTGTMPWESAILGTVSVVGGEFTKKFGNFKEMEQNYHLLHSFTDPSLAVKKAIELIQNTDLKKYGLEKRQKLLAEKIDVTKFMIDFIENYLKSTINHRDKAG